MCIRDSLYTLFTEGYLSSHAEGAIRRELCDEARRLTALLTEHPLGAIPETFALLGMGALFTSVVRAPLTGIVLMVEMTGRYEFMLPLLVSCLTAYGVAEGLQVLPIYDALRHRKPCSPRSMAEEPVR